MAPRKPAPTASTSIPTEIPEEDPLQAVVLADSFNKRFQVLCVDKPRCLLPLLGTPLLAWTLESLSQSNVKEVIIFCGVHADAIKSWVSSSPYSSTLQITCITSPSAHTPGDALRQLDAMQLLNPKSPFLLVQSPVVSSWDMGEMVREHRRIRAAGERERVMTLGVGVGGRRHPESPIMLVDPASSLLLHYTPSPLLPTPHTFPIPSSLLISKTPLNLEVWSGPGGYRDLGIDVCEADVPALFTENFDWGDMRRHLVVGVLMSDLLGKKIGVFKVGDEDKAGKEGGKSTYVERIRDTRTFGDVSRDVLRRWAFPLVPDSNILGDTEYELRRGNCYVAKKGTTLSRSTVLSGPLLLGPRTSLAARTLVRQSTIGADVTVGARTTITDSYVFDNVKIGKGCILEGCIIGEGVVLEDGVTVGRGGLIGDGVRIGKGVAVEAWGMVGREKYVPAGEEDEDEPVIPEGQESTPLSGEGSSGYLWPTEEEALDSDDDLEDPYEHPDNRRLLQLGRRLSDLSIGSSSISTLSHASTSNPPTPASLASDASSISGIPSMSLAVPSAADFTYEALQSLNRAHEERHRVEDALLELKTLMLSSNVGVSGPGGGREVVVSWAMGLIGVEGGARGVKESSDKVWERWGGILEGMGGNGADTLLEVQKYCISNPFYSPFFHLFLSALYSSDVVDSEDIFSWYKLDLSRGKGVDDEDEAKEWKGLWDRGAVFVKALAEAEEESDEESD